jgi:hypothetical protein
MFEIIIIKTKVIQMQFSYFDFLRFKIITQFFPQDKFCSYNLIMSYV